MRCDLPRLRVPASLLLLLMTAAVCRTSEAERVPTPVREADAVCARCHAEIVRRYLQSPMANGSGVATEQPHTGTMHHAVSDVSYGVTEIEGVLRLSVSRPDPVRGGGSGPEARPGLRESHTLLYFLGSGHLGTTYLYNEDGYLLESPVAYYARLRAFEMAPGLGGSDGVPDALPMTEGCMRCHMSEVQQPDAGTRNRFVRAGVPFLHGGITCERCHGDAAAHIRSGGRAAILNPIKLPAAERDSVCSSCHLEGDTSVERVGRSVAEYKPGDRLGDDVAYFVMHSDSTERSVSETEELLTSRCKRVSGAAMSCMSCHDAHGSPPEGERVRFYRAKCLACHGVGGFVQTHFAATPDCTGCHMPRGGAEDTPHVAWTDHRIRRNPAAVLPAAPGPAPAPTLTPVLGAESASSRDFAVAYYKLLMKGQKAFAGEAWRRLNEAVAADRTDAPTLAALGSMNQMQGRASAAEVLYRDALKLRPGDLETANNLGALLAQSGRLIEARDVWQASFLRNRDVESLGVNLSIAQCRTEEGEASLATLRTVLRFNPDSRQARARIRAMEETASLCRTQ